MDKRDLCTRRRTIISTHLGGVVGAITLTLPVAWVAFNAIIAIKVPMIDCGTYAYAFYSIIPPI